MINIVWYHCRAQEKFAARNSRPEGLLIEHNYNTINEHKI
jgi:hypothetical protein